MKKINFLFGIHCHQPVGNFEHVIKEAYEKCYLPFIEVMQRHPRVKFSFHFSGILYDWFLEHHPEFIEVLAQLVRRHQAEVITAGYYEPILPIIPDTDKVGQIVMQNEFIEKHLHANPVGLWLTERIWEPHLPKTLKQAGIEYVTVDDYHFLSAGIPEKELSGYYITEEEGITLKIFPISKKLRYLIPFNLPEETIKYLESIATDEGEGAAILADDGEKFGIWPGTYKWVYEEKYLEKLLTMIEDNSSWINCMTFSEYVENHPPLGRVYLPCASYFEMMEWSLFTEAGIKMKSIVEELKENGKFEEYSRFFRGGFFRNFFVKYPEANIMHKKMLQISSKYHTLKQTHSHLLEEAKRELYMGQCNCAYWHGVFGGLYLSYLRSSIFEHLIKAENIINKISRGNDPYTEVTITDFDCDGEEEIIMSNDLINVYFSPKRGGSIFELDFKPKAFNIQNTLTRRQEAYHKEIKKEKNESNNSSLQTIHSGIKFKEEGLENYLVFDSYQKVSLLDHFFPPDISLHDFSSSSYRENGNFLNGEYGFFPQRKKEEVSATFSRSGTVEINSGRRIPVKLSKKISLLAGQSIMQIEYQITNLGDEEVILWFAPEFNFNLSAGHAPDRYYEIAGKNIKDRNLDSTGILDKVKEIKMVDEYKSFSVSLCLGIPAVLWRFPIETVSQSESGLEKSYQGSTLVSIWQISFKPFEHWNNKIIIKLES